MTTQIPQIKLGGGNTKLPPKRNRNWCFTLNNYKENDITQLHVEKENVSCKQFCFQEEKGENNIPHLQGVISYKEGKTFNVMKKLLPKAHWEICRNLKASLSYCSKERTRVGNIYTYHYTVVKEMTAKDFDFWLREDLPRLRCQQFLDELGSEPI